MIHNHGLKRAAAAQVGFLYIAPYNSRPVAVNFTITVKAGDRYQGELTPTRDLGETLNHAPPISNTIKRLVSRFTSPTHGRQFRVPL
jgi:hypothetical protein